MNILTKHSLGETVYFFYSESEGIGRVEIQSGKVIEIQTRTIRDNGVDTTYVAYKVSVGRTNCDIEEDYLFKRDRDVYAFFKENIREYFDNKRAEELRKKKDEDDDLPF